MEQSVGDLESNEEVEEVNGKISETIQYLKIIGNTSERENFVTLSAWRAVIT